MADIAHPEQHCARRTWLTWFFVGLATALFLQWVQATAVGGWSGLVEVGEHSELRPFIESSLGEIVTTPQGHDGQFTLAIALDPWADTDAHLAFDHGSYRYRRILHPLLGGGFGLFGPKSTLVGIIAVAGIGMAMATASLVCLACVLGARRWIVVGVLLNPGVWLSVQLVTSDALALGLSLSGLVLWTRQHRRWATVVFAFAVLTKDQYLLVPLALAGWEWTGGKTRTALLVGVVPVLPLAGWVGFLSSRMPDAFAPRGNLAFLGVLDSWHVWGSTSPIDQALVVITLAGMAAAGILLFRTTNLLRWLNAPWLALALVSSNWLWDLGNNAARVFAPVWVFGLLAVAVPHQRPTPNASKTDPAAIA